MDSQTIYSLLLLLLFDFGLLHVRSEQHPRRRRLRHPARPLHLIRAARGITTTSSTIIPLPGAFGRKPPLPPPPPQISLPWSTILLLACFEHAYYLIHLGLLDGSYYQGTSLSASLPLFCRLSHYGIILSLDGWTWSCDAMGLRAWGRWVRRDMLGWGKGQEMGEDLGFVCVLVFGTLLAWRKNSA